MCISSPLLIKWKNSNCISGTSCSIFQPSRTLSTFMSLPLTKLSESEYLSGMTFSCLTSTNSMIFKPCTLTTTVPPKQAKCLWPMYQVHQPSLQPENGMKPVATGTKEYVDKEKTASISTYESYVSKKDTPVISAWTRALQEALNLKARWPGWVHNLMWSDLDLGISHATLWTKNAVPLPSIPTEEFHNHWKIFVF